MFRNSIQLSGQLVRAVFSQDQLFVKINHEITKRWAGHNKWSNIKHVKMQKDQSKSATFQGLCKRITWAVKEGGEDPKLNHKLRALIEEAKKVSMPNSTIQNSIKSASASNSVKPYWLIYKGSGGLILSFEVVTPNASHAASTLNQYTKRMNLKLIKNAEEFCTEKGVIISEPLKGVENAYDRALEDAIEFEIEEVVEDEDNTLMFRCLPNKLDAAYTKLVKKGYNVQSSATEIEFHNYVNLSNSDMEALNSIIEKIHNTYEHLVRTSTNVENAKS